MKFQESMSRKQRKAVKDACQTILEKGNEFHNFMIRTMLKSEIVICAVPVAEINASGIAGVIDPTKTNKRIMSERLSLEEAFKEIFITFATETLNGAQGTEGTFVHEGRHAYDFAQAISSFSSTDINPLGVFNPTRYELEWEAHIAAGQYALQAGTDGFIQEGLDLMILGQNDGHYFVSEEGIKRRLLETYNMSKDGNQGELVTEMFGLVIK